MKIDTILFDFDGTLADTSEGIILAMKAMMREMGLPIASDEKIRQGIGLPIKDTARIVAGAPEDKVEEAAASYRRNFGSLGLPQCRLFPGVGQTLEELHSRGYTLGIATSRNRATLVRMLTDFGIAGLFSVMSHQDLGLGTKPSPDLVLYDLNVLGRSAEQTVVVGDTVYDLGMGRNAGCKVCAVTYGNHTREQLEAFGPEWLIDDFRELLSILP